MVILLVISSVVIAYLIYDRTRVKSPKSKPREETTNDQTERNPRHIYDIPLSDYYEYEENDSSTYTGYTDLKRPAAGEPSDDHVYAGLNQALKDLKNIQGQTGHEGH